MNKSLFTCFFVLITFSFLLVTCAKISTPTGGPRDKLPPVIVKSIPEPGEKNFKKNKLTVIFDEYVVLDNVNDKFMVSPPMKKKPRIFIKGKSVNVEFEDKLRDSTTYTFYFQDAIKDLNEGNVIENFQFVFSTGPVIDSLSVTGNISYSFNLEVPEKILVLLYRELADSAVVKHIPDYISRVDLDGYFRIDNVQAGTYRLYALKDDDNSKNYNSVEEEFAFMSSPVEITPEKNYSPVIKDTVPIKKVTEKVPVPVKTNRLAGTTDKDKLPERVVLKGEYPLILFKALRKEHYLTKSSRDTKYMLLYILSLPPDSMNFDFSIPGAGADTYFTERSRNNDTLKVWLADSSLYQNPQIQTIIKYPFTDSLKNIDYTEDTITMRYLAPRAPTSTKVKKPVFTIASNISGGTLKPGQSIVFKSETPFSQPDTTHIKLFELMPKSKKSIPYLLLKDSSNSCKYLLKTNLVQGGKYFFVADSASFSDIYNLFSDSIGIKFTVREAASYSKLILNISNYEGERIIQLLSKDEKIIREEKMKADGKLIFPLLENATYRIRVIYDLNGDGRWTTGNFDTGQLPEPVSYYRDEIEINRTWDFEQDWDIGLINFKEQKLKALRKAK